VATVCGVVALPLVQHRLVDGLISERLELKSVNTGTIKLFVKELSSTVGEHLHRHDI